MDDKIFAEQVLKVLSENAFAIEKLLLNLDDCVPKSDLDTVELERDNLRGSVSNLTADLNAAKNFLQGGMPGKRPRRAANAKIFPTPCAATKDLSAARKSSLRSPRCTKSAAQ